MIKCVALLLPIIARSLLRILTRSTAAAVMAVLLPCAALGQQVTYKPYIQLGDNGVFGPTDQVVIAWQTDQKAPTPSAYKAEFQIVDRKRPSFTRAVGSGGGSVTPDARVVDNYLAADPALPVIAGAYGAHSNYTAVLKGLKYDTAYRYRVTGPGMPDEGFIASFRTRKRRDVFSFAVVGDEGIMSPNVTLAANQHPATAVNFEARIAHLINNVEKLTIPGVPALPPAEFVLNAGDNVYVMGSEDNYRDFFFPVYNSDEDSNDAGAPLLRSKLYFVSPGNHDIGNGNLLADDFAPPFGFNISGGDALAYFNNFYFPLNGPKGFDVQYQWNGDISSPTGFSFQYRKLSFQSPLAITEFRASTKTDTGKGEKPQIDHMSNYSFDYGNAHFLFLDANPHLFNGIASTARIYNGPQTASLPAYPPYPSALAKWIIKDLDASKQLWKIVVFHQPAFSSGNSTAADREMRAVVKLLEDHGVNIIFNGHEHNYQRTFPIRATDRTAVVPTATGSPPAVIIDQHFDGNANIVPDGVLYLVEGGGGAGLHDGDSDPVDVPRTYYVPSPDQDESATGSFTYKPGLVVPQGSASWLDTNLTSGAMRAYLPNAGQGPKITAKFKSRLFSFGDVIVDHNKLTLYQISEPLQSTSSATAIDPAPYGTDINGKPLNDPLPPTLVDIATRKVISAPATGIPALLDKCTVTKPDVKSSVSVELSAPDTVTAGKKIVYTASIRNGSQYALNGTQLRFLLPETSAIFETGAANITTHGNEAVVTLGRIAPGAIKTAQVPMLVSSWAQRGKYFKTSAQLYSATALPVSTNSAVTRIE